PALDSPQSDATVSASDVLRPQRLLGCAVGVSSGDCRMKKLIFASVGLIAVVVALRTATAANADVDGPPPVVYGPPVTVVLFTWTGFYFGGHAGGAWGHKTETGNPYSFFNGLLTDTITPAPASVDVNGWLGGGQIGANYQIGSLVFGAEA